MFVNIAIFVAMWKHGSNKIVVNKLYSNNIILPRKRKLPENNAKTIHNAFDVLSLYYIYILLDNIISMLCNICTIIAITCSLFHIIM